VVYVAGYATGDAGDTDWWIKRFGTDGTEVIAADGWDKVRDGDASGDDGINDLYVDGSGNVSVAGYGTGVADPPTVTGEDAWITVYAGAGFELTDWLGKTFDGEAGGAARATSVAFSETLGSLCFGGYGSDLHATGSGNDWWIKMFEPAGTEITAGWDKRLDIGVGSNDQLLSVTADASGDLYAAGHSDGSWVIRKYDSEGTEYSTWGIVTDAGGAGSVHGTAVNSFGHLYAVGQGTGEGWIKKFQTDSIEIAEGWSKRITGGAGATAVAYGVAVDAAHNTIVVGAGSNLVDATTGEDWWIHKYFDDKP